MLGTCKGGDREGRGEGGKNSTGVNSAPLLYTPLYSDQEVINPLLNSEMLHLQLQQERDRKMRGVLLHVFW